MARPRIEINWTEFDKLCGLQCSLVEIASWFDCSVDTIERAVEREHNIGFAAYFEQKRGKGKIALRRKQFDVAINGNVSMLIWLGKQYLGQMDKQEVSSTSTLTVNESLTPDELKRIAAKDPLLEKKE